MGCLPRPAHSTLKRKCGPSSLSPYILFLFLQFLLFVPPIISLSLSLSLYSISSFLLPFLSAPSLLSFSSFLHSASLPKFFQLSYILISLYLSLFLIPASFTPSMLYFFPFIPDFIFHLDFSLFPLFPILYLHSSWPHLYTLNTSSAPLSSRGYSNIITTNILSTITIASTRYPP